jgi:hypothetical protein
LISGLVAAFVVHLLTQSRERERWILDCKKQEFRELLSALADSYVAVRDCCDPKRPTISAEEKNRLSTASMNFYKVMRDRIFVVEDLPLSDMRRRWFRVFKEYGEVKKLDRVDEVFQEVTDIIVEAANRCVPKSTGQRLKFWKA